MELHAGDADLHPQRCSVCQQQLSRHHHFDGERPVAPSLTNSASVSGGGETNTSNDSASDVTTVTQLPDPTISKSHSGNFTQGQTRATYTITVSNGGTGSTSGTVTAIDTLPRGGREGGRGGEEKRE